MSDPPSGAFLSPPGWFSDPYGTASLRWWDGAVWTTYTASPEEHSKKPKVWPPILLIGIGGLGMTIGLVIFLLSGFAGLVDSPVHQSPTTVDIDCHVGDYYVYQHVGYQESGPGFSYSSSGIPTLRSDQVQVSGPNGIHLGTWSGDGSETITKGSWIYSNAVGFHVSAGGRYTVRITPTLPSTVIVAPSIGSQFVRAAPWLILSGAGGLIAFLGIVLLIVVIIRRRPKSTMVVSGGPPSPPSVPNHWA
jgi:hypothetical protein